MIDGPDVLAALIRFEQRLERAQATADGRGHGALPPGPTPERFAQELLAKAVQLLMEDIGLGRFTGLPLTMIQALGDLDRGHATGPLTPSTREDQRTTLAEARTMARAVKALDLLRTRGPGGRRLSVAAAAAKVFEAVPQTGLAKSSATIIGWRKDVQSKRAPHDVMRLMEMPLPVEAGTTAAEQAAWLLRMLAEAP